MRTGLTGDDEGDGVRHDGRGVDMDKDDGGVCRVGYRYGRAGLVPGLGGMGCVVVCLPLLCSVVFPHCVTYICNPGIA